MPIEPTMTVQQGRRLAMLQFHVNDKLCKRCGLCAQDCIAEIIKQEGDALPRIDPALETDCLQCQHCLAICPSAAISILGKKPGDSLSLSAGNLPRLEQMERLVRGRRSVRHYRDENVDPALVSRLLATLANVPTGVNQRELTFTVIDDKAAMQRFREAIVASLAKAVGAGRIPDDSYLHDAVTAYQRDKTDIILRGAPHLLLVSAPPDAPCPNEDVALALAYFDLLAQSAGLGTVWCGLLKMTLEAAPELKPLLGLPANHAYYAMLFGPPAIRFARTVQRDEAAPIRKLTHFGGRA
jgi:nitroreductase/Pyruvate/2-oxoacid:ferredoxin oxidoreductase delta subunit